MNRISIALLLVLLIALNAIARQGLQNMGVDSANADAVNLWSPTMVTALNLSQIAFSNWTQGGSNSLAWTVTANVGYNYSGRIWGLKNHLRASYGRSKLGGQASIITDNDFLFENVLTYNVGWATNPFFSNTIITTIAEGYSYASSVPTPIANFFDPGYVTQSLGVEYTASSHFSTRFGLATREIFANKFRQYTNPPGATGNLKVFNLQTGIESVSHGKLQIAENMLLTSGLRLFTRFSNLTVWDVRWDNLIAAKVNSFIVVNVTYQLVYQKDQSLRTQMKEGLQLGLTYTLF